METHSVDVKLPLWIWHPEREKRLSLVLTRTFKAEHDISQVSFHTAFTGGARILLDGALIATVDEQAGNAGAFMQIASFPAALAAGEHELRLELTCSEIVPLAEVNYYLWDRRVGAIAYLQGEGLWLASDEEWAADESQAAVICLLGEEPFGDLENSPSSFVIGGFGDIRAYDLNHVTLLQGKAIQASVSGSSVRLTGQHGADGNLTLPKQEQLQLFYHLRKQDEWKAMRGIQSEMALEEASTVVLDIGAEHNCRFIAVNNGLSAVKLLWNGGESQHELNHYDGCITEWVVVEPGQTVCTLPQGFRYIQLQVLGEAGQPFDLELTFQTVHVALNQVGRLESDSEQLNEIFNVAAHTSRICHQIGLWDGIKRDRLNWTFDFYLAAKSDYFLWDDYAVIRRAVRELGFGTPSGHWMNSICEYTLWWIKTVCEYYVQTGDKAFVLELKEPLQRHVGWVQQNTRSGDGLLVQEGILVEWVPISDHEKRIALQAIYALTLQDLKKLSANLPELELEFSWPLKALASSEFMKPEYALAVKTLGIASGYVSDEAAVAFLESYTMQDPLTPLSGFQLAECYSRYGRHEQAHDVISRIWGGMLDNGATTFWEACKLDITGAQDFHDALTTYTAYGSYRMSLCHAWSSTPVKWIGEIVLGVQPLEPGYRSVRIAPTPVGGIRACSGTVNTPLGPLTVKWHLDEKGELQTFVTAPAGMKLVEPDRLNIEQESL
ncbi:alpha-L-rhamnosidase C-terminal domain-containing protein [Paenibacillus sacheonensis]|uniref:Alpha-L-rhamnosidase n=1 Tax=Paenibacillus sacheonensis TaxID=742054 RepID=A0A7X4YLA0_9BACL|nr:alpha-L-rhamnosidase C-terminal domain-containing protein [Paenibacillus sacheonensis]MBM7568350.1 hypothetical protein [Paenibacillus sacheonensis]NBC68467.1 alpha-L-rhamnosidase [Paenibacillus sacheonensis]